MKTIPLRFEDMEYKKIQELKKKLSLTWEDFILFLCSEYEKHEEFKEIKEAVGGGK